VVVPVKVPAMCVFVIYVSVSAHPVVVLVHVAVTVAAVHGNVQCLY